MRYFVWFVAVVLALDVYLVSTVEVQERGLPRNVSEPPAPSRTNQDDAEAMQLVQVMQLREGATVADIGAGSGMFTAALADHLPPDVRVIATDLRSQLPPLVKGLQRSGAEKRVTVVEGAVASTNLPNGSCDALVVRRTYHHIFQPAAMLKSFYRTLRRGGRLFVIESPLMRLNPLPNDTPGCREGDGINLPVLLKELSAGGFVHERTVDPFFQQRYLVVMRKP